MPTIDSAYNDVYPDVGPVRTVFDAWVGEAVGGAVEDPADADRLRAALCTPEGYEAVVAECGYAEEAVRRFLHAHDASAVTRLFGGKHHLSSAEVDEVVAMLQQRRLKLETESLELVQEATAKLKDRRAEAVERYDAARHLAQSGHPRALDELLEVLEDSVFDDEHLAEAVAGAVRRFGDPAAVGKLNELIGAPKVRLHARRGIALALEALGNMTSVRPMVKTLATALGDGDFILGDRLLYGLKRITGVDLGRDAGMWTAWVDAHLPGPDSPG
jgi:hypothetical protein